MCQPRAALCQEGFPHCSHHPHLLLQLPPARQFLCCNVPSPSCFLPAFFQKHCQGNWASLSTARSDTAPLTAATGSSTSAQPTLREHQHCQRAQGLDLSSQTCCPPPIQQAVKGESFSPRATITTQEQYAINGLSRKHTAKDGEGKEKKKKKPCFPLASPGWIHTQKRDLHLNGC